MNCCKYLKRLKLIDEKGKLNHNKYYLVYKIVGIIKKYPKVEKLFNVLSSSKEIQYFDFSFIASKEIIEYQNMKSKYLNDLTPDVDKLKKIINFEKEIKEQYKKIINELRN